MSTTTTELHKKNYHHHSHRRNNHYHATTTLLPTTPHPRPTPKTPDPTHLVPRVPRPHPLVGALHRQASRLGLQAQLQALHIVLVGDQASPVGRSAHEALPEVRPDRRHGHHPHQARVVLLRDHRLLGGGVRKKGGDKVGQRQGARGGCWASALLVWGCLCRSCCCCCWCLRGGTSFCDALLEELMLRWFRGKMTRWSQGVCVICSLDFRTTRVNLEREVHTWQINSTSRIISKANTNAHQFSPKTCRGTHNKNTQMVCGFHKSEINSHEVPAGPRLYDWATNSPPCQESGS